MRACARSRCADLIFLVVTGPARGQVWEDLTPYDQRIGPIAASFTDWYEAELDEALRWAQSGDAAAG